MRRRIAVRVGPAAESHVFTVAGLGDGGGERQIAVKLVSCFARAGLRLRRTRASRKDAGVWSTTYANPYFGWLGKKWQLESR